MSDDEDNFGEMIEGMLLEEVPSYRRLIVLSNQLLPNFKMKLEIFKMKKASCLLEYEFVVRCFF